MTALKPRLPVAVEWAHHLLESTLEPGGIAVDATLGNGHDALYLAQKVGPEGHVYGFDLQAEALEKSRTLLLSHEIAPRQFTFFQQSHHLMAASLPTDIVGRVGAMVFNLGYLPGGEKGSTTTTVWSTRGALRAGAPLLRVGGVMVVVAYPGHPGGDEEAEAVEAWMMGLDASEFEVQQVRAMNRLAPPPILWMVLRRRAA